MSEEQTASRLGFLPLDEIIQRADEIRSMLGEAKCPLDDLTWPALLLVAIHFGRLHSVPESETRLTSGLITDIVYRGTSASPRAMTADDIAKAGS